MKRILSLLLCALLLAGCGSTTVTEFAAETAPPTAAPEPSGEPPAEFTAPEYTSRFSAVTGILLSEEGISVDGGEETETVFTSRDIIYYEDRETYDSGNPYGEGTEADRHTAQEAAEHTVVNITAPGAYRISGTLPAGQIRIDLGEDAYADPEAVVELILQDADITCTVAPAILFLNVYECDGDWSEDTAKARVDTTAAGASLILQGENRVDGSYVARIYKDQEEEKKLWKQDGAIYSYMSMNVFGPGALELTAGNEGLDTELHLTVNGGDITIRSGNDGINTNEDNVSVTTINGGRLIIEAGLGDEGDGIDSNGYLVINGGVVIAAAKPAADAGLDADLGSFIHGGTVVAMGAAMDWAESDSGQVTMNLQFAGQQKAGAAIRITDEKGTELFSFTPEMETPRSFSGVILSCPALKQGQTCHVYIDGVQMAYTGTDTLRGGPGGMGGRGQMPEGFDPGQPPALPEGETLPEDFDPSRMGHGNREGMEPPQGFEGERPAMPEGETLPEGALPPGGFGGPVTDIQTGEASTRFFLQDMVNFFSGVRPAA